MEQSNAWYEHSKKANKTYKTEMETKSIWEAISITNPKTCNSTNTNLSFGENEETLQAIAPTTPSHKLCFYTKIERGLNQQGLSKFTTRINWRRNSEKAIPDYVNPKILSSVQRIMLQHGHRTNESSDGY